jgi:hypothetical protein
VRLPVVITGDFNGSPRGVVYQYIRSQNYRNAFEEIKSKTAEKSSDGLNSITMENSTWVSHKSHRGDAIFVDHVFYLNPSEQTEEQLPPLPDWTNLVYRELMQRILDQRGEVTMGEIFSTFDEDGSNFVSREEFRAALRLEYFINYHHNISFLC